MTETKTSKGNRQGCLYHIAQRFITPVYGRGDPMVALVYLPLQ